MITQDVHDLILIPNIMSNTVLRAVKKKWDYKRCCVDITTQLTGRDYAIYDGHLLFI